MKELKTGLFIGKFAPFHKGHQYIVDTALREVDQLLIMIYDCPETTNIPLNTRANWIRKLYPKATVIGAWEGPSETGYTDEIKHKQENYILNKLNGRKITHFYSSEPYGKHMSMALGAINRTIDVSRKNVPISGTKIRENPYRYRQYIDDVVYRDLVMNIVFLGGPSTGKSTITQELAKKYNTVFMPEYGREYWDKHQVSKRLTLEQLLEIAKGHIKREDKLLLKANKYLFTDTNTIITYLFSLYYHGKALPELEQMAEACISRYDFVFLCDTDIPYDDTWDRSGDANRNFMQEQTIAYLKEHDVPYVVLRGNVQERMKQVESVLETKK